MKKMGYAKGHKEMAGAYKGLPSKASPKARKATAKPKASMRKGYGRKK